MAKVTFHPFDKVSVVWPHILPKPLLTAACRAKTRNDQSTSQSTRTFSQNVNNGHENVHMHMKAERPSHTGDTHLPTASVKVCWREEDPYSRLCKAVQRPGGVTHSEKNRKTRQWSGKADALAAIRREQVDIMTFIVSPRCLCKVTNAGRKPH